MSCADDEIPFMEIHDFTLEDESEKVSFHPRYTTQIRNSLKTTQKQLYSYASVRRVLLDPKTDEANCSPIGPQEFSHLSQRRVCKYVFCYVFDRFQYFSTIIVDTVQQ